MFTRTYGSWPLGSTTLALFALFSYADVQRIGSAGSPFWRDGLLARFDWITTAEKEQHTNTQFPKGQRLPPAELVDGLREFDKMLGRARVNIAPVTETQGNGKDKVLRYDVEVTRQADFVVELSDDVYAAVERYDNWLRDTVAGGLVEDLRASYGRMAERTLRIACLLAAYERRTTCELRDWKKAQAIMERRRLCLHWTYERLTDTAEAAEKVSKTDAILRYVTTARCVTARDIQSKFRRRFPTGIAELQRELDALVEAGELHCVTGKRKRVFYAVDASSLPAAADSQNGASKA